jgi:hypothetical protein
MFLILSLTDALLLVCRVVESGNLLDGEIGTEFLENQLVHLVNFPGRQALEVYANAALQGPRCLRGLFGDLLEATLDALYKDRSTLGGMGNVP